MKFSILYTNILALCISPFVSAGEGSATPATGNEKVGSALRFKAKDIGGKEVDLAAYQGSVVLFVNVASKCGLTPQYEQLQALHKKFNGKGLRVLGFPANQFGKQEPGTNSEISVFCKEKYDVSFEMFSKVVVKGKGICGLYRYLVSSDAKPKGKGGISWNFEKVLVGRDGEVRARFSPRTKPDSKEFITAVEDALAAAK
jgi:glutathione peroxidase